MCTENQTWGIYKGSGFYPQSHLSSPKWLVLKVLVEASESKTKLLLTGIFSDLYFNSYVCIYTLSFTVYSYCSLFFRLLQNLYIANSIARVKQPTKYSWWPKVLMLLFSFRVFMYLFCYNNKPLWKVLTIIKKGSNTVSTFMELKNGCILA